jgi:hypothetical protein
MNSLPEFIGLAGLKLHGFVTNVTDWVGHIGLQARMTLWIIRLAQETDARWVRGGMCKRTPQPSTETGPCTFAIVQFGWVHEIRFSLTINSRRIILRVLSRKLLRDSAQFGTQTETEIDT